MSKCTPGEWIVEGTTVYALNEQGENRMCFNVKNGGYIWRSHDPIGGDSEHTPLEEFEANARLVGAAPKMLAALKTIAADLNARKIGVTACSIAERAIALAEGTR
jgi:hypothetical protein